MVSSILEVVIDSGIILYWTPHDSDDANEILSLFGHAEREYPGIIYELVVPDHKKDLAVQLLSESVDAPVVWVISDNIAAELKTGVYLVENGGQPLRWGDASTLEDAELISRVRGAASGVASILSIDDMLDLEGSSNPARERSYIDVQCSQVAIESVAGLHAEYVDWMISFVENQTLHDLAFWDLIVLAGVEEIHSINVADCFRSSFAPFVAMRLTSGQIDIKGVPTDTSISGSLVKLGKSIFPDARAIWVTDGPELPEWHPKASNLIPIALRTIKVSNASNAHDEVREALGIDKDGAVLIVY
jgi:hypothetical protein